MNASHKTELNEQWISQMDNSNSLPLPDSTHYQSTSLIKEVQFFRILVPVFLTLGLILISVMIYYSSTTVPL